MMLPEAYGPSTNGSIRGGTFATLYLCPLRVLSLGAKVLSPEIRPAPSAPSMSTRRGCYGWRDRVGRQRQS